jgi:excisionase family DNA binding protein
MSANTLIYDERQLPAFLTTEQFARLFQMNVVSVQRMCQNGELPAFRVGARLWRIDKNAALAKMRSGGLGV